MARGRGRGGRRGRGRAKTCPEPSVTRAAVPSHGTPVDQESIQDSGDAQNYEDAHTEDPILREAVRQSLEHSVMQEKMGERREEQDLQAAIKASLSNSKSNDEESYGIHSSSLENKSTSDAVVVELSSAPSSSSSLSKEAKSTTSSNSDNSIKDAEESEEDVRFSHAPLRFRQQYKIAEQYFNRMMRRRVSADVIPRIKSIDIVTSEPFEQAFQRQREAFEMASVPTKEIFAFHASDVANLDHVLNNNLQVKYATATKYGRGVYFSEYPNCKIGYAGAGLLLCRILPGMELVDASFKLIPEGCHSKRVPSQGGSEEVLVVENSSQIRPCCVIHLERPEREVATTFCLDYKYVPPVTTDSSLVGDHEAEIFTMSKSSASETAGGNESVVNLDSSLADDDDDDDDYEVDDDDVLDVIDDDLDCEALFSGASRHANRSNVPQPKGSQTMLMNDEISKKARNMFESSLKLHETGEHMQASETVNTSLYPHQMYALAWMANRENSTRVGVAGGILADDMGLGKTLTVLSLIMTNFHDKRPLAMLQLGYSRSKHLAPSVVRYMPSAFATNGAKRKKGTVKEAQKLREFDRLNLFGLGLGKRRKDTRQKVKSSSTSFNRKSRSKINFSDDDDGDDGEDEEEEDGFDSMCNGSLSEKLLSGNEDLFQKSEQHHYDGLSDDEEYQSMSEKERNEKMRPKFKNDDDLGINLDGMPKELESSDDDEQQNKAYEPGQKRKIGSKHLCAKPTKVQLLDDENTLPDLDDDDEEEEDSVDVGKGEPEKPKAVRRQVAHPQLTEEQRKNLIIPPREPPILDGRRRSTLIVTPASLISHWLHQIEEHIDDSVELRIYVHHGQCRAMTGMELEECDVVLTTYGTLMSEFNSQTVGPLLRARWLRAVLDEGHFIKNHRSKTHKAAYDLDVKRKWIVTGTPIQNNLTELWSLLYWLDFEPYASHRVLFRNQIEQAVKRGHPNGIQRLQTVMQAICLRRMKTDRINGRPLVELPEKDVRLVELEFSQEERTVYEAYKTQARELIARYMRRGTLMRNYAHVFAVMMRLRQLCCHRDLLPVKWKDVNMNELVDFVKKEMSTNEEDGSKGDVDKDRIMALAEQLRQMIMDGMTDECSICLSEFKHPVITKCAHVYCRECITQYIEAAERPPAQCPLCRSDLDVKDLLEAASGEEDDSDELSKKSSCDPFEDIVVDVSSTKVNAVLRELEISKAKGDSDKTIVVSQFTSLLSIFQPLLDDAGHTWTRLDGSMNTRERIQVIAEFQNSSLESPRVLLLSLRAGGVGLNLTAANRLILVDPAWNPSTEEQCFDRIHRLGQTRDVEVLKLVHNNSIEERMLAIQSKKKNLISGAFRQTAAEQRQQRIQDIRDIFDL